MSLARVEPVGDLLAVDPGINKPGVALFRAGLLVAAERVKLTKDLVDLPVGARCVRVASAIMRWGMTHDMDPRVLVFEWPQVYTASKSKGDPNDLLKVAGVGTAVAAMLSLGMVQRNICLDIHSPTPAEWVGQLPKVETGDPWLSPRGARVKSCLSADELAAVVPSHDAVDAVGLGLKLLGRFEPVCVYPC